MRIQNFARICLAAAKGSDTLELVSDYEQTQAFYDNLIATAEAQRVLPLISYMIAGVDCRKSCKANNIDVSGIKKPMHFVTRNMHLKAQLLQIDKALNTTNINPALLKGAIHLFDPIYSSIGMRHMADIDILSTDIEFLEVLDKLGYAKIEHGQVGLLDKDDNLNLNSGEYHLAPLIRNNDLVTLEPHILPVSPMYMNMIPKSFEIDTLPVPNCDNFVQPTPVNHLIHVLIHTLKHDRDTLDGGILLRGLIDCELIYEKMTPKDRVFAEQHFINQNAKSLWQSWRSLSDWVFNDTKHARYNSFSSFLLITEFEARSLGYRMVFIIAFINRFIQFFKYRYWSTNTYKKHIKRLIKNDFWERIFSKFKTALKG